MNNARFLLRIVLPIAVLVGTTLALVYWQAARNRMLELGQAEEKYVALLAEALKHDFQAVTTDLMVLADSGEFRAAVDDPQPADSASVAASFRRFMERKRVYDQIRYLDLQGMETVRVNFDRRSGRGTIVPDSRLQSKQDRYYFQETRQLAVGQIFVSPFDLNVEDGRIETPRKPTIRFATPIADSHGTKRGILVLNYLGQVILNRFARLDADSPGRAMLINLDGYWLYDAVGGREWSFMYPDRMDVNAPHAYPDVWQQMQHAERGSLTNRQGLFTFTTVQPFLAESPRGDDAPPTVTSAARLDRRWYVVSRVDPPTIAAHLSSLRQAMWLISFLTMAIVIGSSSMLSRYAFEREQSRKALRVSESRFRQMAGAIQEVFWMSDAERSRFVYVSPAFSKIWARPLENLNHVMQTWESAIHPDDRETAIALRHPASSQPSYSVQYRIVRPDGESRWIWDQGFAIHDDQQQVISYAGIAEDITPLKDAQRQLLQNARLAAVGEAITGLAHESRNALQRSQSCLEMLGKRVADRPEATDLVRRTQAALRDLHYLYEHVRNYAAPLQLEFVKCDLRSIWQQTCEDLHELIQSRGAMIRLPDETTVAAPVDASLIADATALRQVFRNILENALAVELDGTSNRTQVIVEVTWRATTIEGRDGVEVRVHDNGPGFADGQCERIFEPFFTTKTRGTGLGMAIVRRIIAAHSGVITAACHPEGGLVVILQLPKVPL